MGAAGLFMAVLDNNCVGRVGGSHFSLRLCLWRGEAEVLMAVPDASCWGRSGGSHSSPRCCLWGEAGVLMAVQTLVVVRRGRGSQGSHRCGLLSLEMPDSHSNPRCLLWRGEAGVLMAVPDHGCGGDRRGFSWQFPDSCCGMCLGMSIHGSLTGWLWG